MKRLVIVFMFCLAAWAGFETQAADPAPKPTPAPAPAPSPADAMKRSVLSAKLLMERGKGWDCKMTALLYPPQGDPFTATVDGAWSKRGTAHMTINAVVAGVPTTTELFHTTSSITVVLTSAIGGQKFYATIPATLQRGYPFMTNTYQELEKRFSEIFEESGIEYFVYQVIDIEKYEEFLPFSEAQAKEKQEAMEKVFTEAVDKYKTEMKPIMAAPEYVNYLKLLDTWKKTKQGAQPVEPQQATVAGKPVRIPKAPVKPVVKKDSKAYKTFEQAEADAKSRGKAIKFTPEPPDLDSLLKLYKVKKDFTLEAVNTDDQELKRFDGIRIITKETRAGKAVPVDYFIDSGGVVRGIVYHDAAGRKVMVVRVEDFHVRENPDIPDFKVDKENEKDMQKISPDDLEKYLGKK